MKSVKEDRKGTRDDDEERTFESVDNASTRWHLIRRGMGGVWGGFNLFNGYRAMTTY
jgi:hypothetical protein